jgi:UDP-glucose:(heptosyl)LPS alpha-1,3-glucosyltransferase
VKIALVILHADPARGGAERYTIDIAAALVERGHEVTLIASSFAESVDARIQRVMLSPSGLSRTRRYVQFLDQLDAHLATGSYDVVHAMLPVRRCDVYHPHAGLAVAAIETGHEKHRGAARAAAKMFNRFNPKRQKFAALERELLHSAHRPISICLSEYVRRTFHAYYTLADTDLATLFNAVDLSRFDPSARPEVREQTRQRLAISDAEVAALLIAQDFERKGLREAILAMTHLADAKLKLIVVGKEDPAPYAQLAQSKNIADKIIFAGATNDVQAFYGAADFFVLPTKHDPCSLVVLEALAMGLPVISTKQNGATEIMEDGVDGIVLADPANVDDLAAAMRRLCDPVVCSEMSAACLARRGRLSFDRHLEQLTNIYGLAIGRRAARR